MERIRAQAYLSAGKCARRGVFDLFCKIGFLIQVFI